MGALVIALMANDASLAPHGRQFFVALADFLVELRLTFPESAHRFDTLRDAIFARQDMGTLRNLVQRLQHHEQLISHADEALFLNEGTTVTLLPGIDFRVLWTKNISGASKVAIWQYLQLLLRLGSSTLMDCSDVDDTTIPPAQADPSPESPSLVEELAEEVMREFKLDDQDAQTPQDLLSRLLCGEGGIASMIGRVSEKVRGRIESGQLDEHALMDETRNMMAKLTALGSEKPADAQQRPDVAGIQRAMETCLRAVENGPGNLDVGSVLKDLMGSLGADPSSVPTTPSGSAPASPPNILKAFMGMSGGLADAELMDLQDLEKKVRRDLRSEYRIEKERHDNDRRGRPVPHERQDGARR